MNQNILNEVLYYEQLSLPMFLLVVISAFILGAIHALGPGHGKSLMAAYLIGSTGRVIDAVILALTITISHVFSVVIIGLLAFWIADFFWPEKITTWIGLFSGIAIFFIGLWLFFSRYKTLKQKSGTHKAVTENVHQHTNQQHHHTNQNHHHFNPNLSIWNNIALGISSGIVPCPKAIVILLLAISLQKIAFGILIILVFSLGIASILIILGIILVKASYLLEGRLEGKQLKLIPTIGAVLIMGLGIFMIIRVIII